MPFRPKSLDDTEHLSEEIWNFLIHPYTTPFTPVMMLADYLDVAGYDYDTGESIRNTLLWGGLISGVAAVNYLLHGSKYTLFGNPRHLAMVLPGVAVGSAMATASYFGTKGRHRLMTEHGAGTPGSFGASPSHHLKDGKPWYSS